MAFTANDLANMEDHADAHDIPALIREIEHLYVELDGISGLCGDYIGRIKSDNIQQVRSAASELVHIRAIAEEARGRVPDPGN